MLQKPLQPVLAQPYAAKARAVFTFNEGYGSTIKDLVKPSRVVNLRDGSGASTYNTWKNGPLGRSFDYDGNIGHFAEAINNDLRPPDITIVLHLKVSTTTSAQKLFNVWTTGSPFQRSWLIQTVAPNNLLWVPDSGGLNAAERATWTNWRTEFSGQWVTVAARAKLGEKSKIWTNGKLGATSSGNKSAIISSSGAAEPVVIGSASAGSGDTAVDEYDEPIALAALFESLPEEQCQYLSYNPLAMFQTHRVPYDIYDSEFAAATGGIPYWLLNQPRQVVGI